jgi:trehalose 6-phosphate synthase/phosphatase
MMCDGSIKRLVIVSNRLPFQLHVHNQQVQVNESDGGLVSALKSYLENQSEDYSFDSVLWLGAAEFQEKLWNKFRAHSSSSLRYDVEPVFIERKTYNQYYNGFCNATLWPLFHYFPSFVEYDHNTFRSYEDVNRIFAEKIVSLLKPGDFVWVHDYQLMLLPQMIREQFADIPIGFFLHIPFPSYEIFRLLHKPWKEKLVRGLLGADLIGFHTHEYVQHFLKAVQMVCGYDNQFRTIHLPNRIIKAEMFPLGIDFEKFHVTGTTPVIMERRDSIRANFADQKIIFSVDRLDYTKGITHRMLGFEKFLERHPEWKEKVVFILVVVPSRQVISKYTERKKLIEEEIGRINGKYSTLSWQPIIYRYSQLSFTELTAMYTVADVGLITPLRDGMNLVAKEFVACKADTGVLILSELAGAANEMGEALLVNPMDEEEVSSAIVTALTMSENDQRERIAKLKQRLRDYTVVHWMSDFINQIHEVKELQRKQETRYLSKASMSDLVAKFNKSQKRLLLLDYDGTLVGYARHPSLAIPDKRLVELLRLLSTDIRNDITIISGRDSSFLQAWFGDLPVNLVSEHGVGVKLKSTPWTYRTDVEPSWKQIIKPVLEIFARRSPGAFIEEKKYTLVWHYRNVDAELGFIRSRELLDYLHHMVRNSLLHIIDGNKVIEIRIVGNDKGTITLKFLEEHSYDFVVSIGDDKTDEDMFRALGDKGYTIKVGPGPTSAQYYMKGQQDVLELLDELNKTSCPIYTAV